MSRSSPPETRLDPVPGDCRSCSKRNSCSSPCVFLEERLPRLSAGRMTTLSELGARRTPRRSIG